MFLFKFFSESFYNIHTTYIQFHLKTFNWLQYYVELSYQGILFSHQCVWLILIYPDIAHTLKRELFSPWSMLQSFELIKLKSIIKLLCNFVVWQAIEKGSKRWKKFTTRRSISLGFFNNTSSWKSLEIVRVIN